MIRVLYLYENEQYNCSVSTSSGRGILLPKKSSSTALKFRGNKINYIEPWLQVLEELYMEL